MWNLSERVSGPAVPYWAHSSVMDAQPWRSPGSEPVWYYSCGDSVGIPALAFWNMHKRQHCLCEFMVRSSMIHRGVNLRGCKKKRYEVQHGKNAYVSYITSPEGNSGMSITWSDSVDQYFPVSRAVSHQHGAKGLYFYVVLPPLR